MRVGFIPELGAVRMLSQISDIWQFNFWLGLASLCAGLVVISPCLLLPTLRRRILLAELEIECVGLIALAVAIVATGCYNYFSGTGGA
ncbi:hypothetical protein AXG53_07005 [Stenotrophomonas sp. KCTC 12332]|nr:hypothetical protein AXG53_07005 [Stenotrophomonas sp. KCTC 12332]